MCVSVKKSEWRERKKSKRVPACVCIYVLPCSCLRAFVLENIYPRIWLCPLRLRRALPLTPSPQIRKTSKPNLRRIDRVTSTIKFRPSRSVWDCGQGSWSWWMGLERGGEPRGTERNRGEPRGNSCFVFLARFSSGPDAWEIFVIGNERFSVLCFLFERTVVFVVAVLCIVLN